MHGHFGDEEKDEWLEEIMGDIGSLEMAIVVDYQVISLHLLLHFFFNFE